MTWHEILNTGLFIALIAIIWKRTGPNHFIDTLAGQALHIKKIEDRQTLMDDAEERIKEYVASFHRARLEAEHGAQQGIARATAELQEIRKLTEQLTQTIPRLAGQIVTLESWKNGVDSQLAKVLYHERG